MLRLLRLGLQDFAVFFFAFGLCLLQVEGFAGDPGLGWHLKTGEYIFSNQSIPSHDQFLFWNVTEPWIVDQWFADLVFYGFYFLGDWALLYSFLIALYLFTCVYLLYKFLVKSSQQYLISSLALIYPFTFAQVHFICRPVVFSFLFFLLFFERLNQKNLTLKSLVWIFIVVCLWANSHPSFILVWLLLPLVYVFRKFDLRTRIYLTVVTLLGTLLTPYHFNLYFSVINLSISQITQPFYTEWGRPEMNYIYASLILLPLVVFLFRKDKNTNLFLLFAYIFFAAASFKAVRFFPYFGIIASFFLVSLFKNVSFFGTWQNLEDREKNANQGRLVFLSILIILAVTSIFYKTTPLYHRELGPQRELYPFEAMELLTRDSTPKKVLNDINLGGFITLYGKGIVKPFADDRTILLGMHTYRYLDRYLSPQYVFALAKAKRADYLLLSNSARYFDLIHFFREQHKEKIVLIDSKVALIKFVF